ncbi:MAG: dethiobiotin synthase [Nitrospiraceae bacterium]|nr:dethiobiotin synthase [Nitrospiraceae bacterium]
MAKGFFITATGTGVGKTVVAGALIRLLKDKGLKVAAMKPVESGCRKIESAVSHGGQSGGGVFFVPADGVFLREMAEMEESVHEVVPYCFEAPLAPMAAAEIERVRIDIKKIISRFERLSAGYDAVIVEGIGGLLVPIKRDQPSGRTGGYYVLDLALELGLPLVIVASLSLGTINHTLLTVRCALGAGAEVAGVIVNHGGNQLGHAEGLAEKTNPRIIRELSPVPVIGELPFLHDISAGVIGDAAQKNIDFSLLKRFL